MTGLRVRFSLCSTLACLAVVSPPAIAQDGDDGNQRSSVTASFGRGLNTALPPGQPIHHAILPEEIKVKVNGVVDFGIAGFHDIIIFKPGVSLQDLMDAGGGQIPSFPPVFVLPPDPTTPLPDSVAFLADKIYYRGLNPAGGPLQTPPAHNPDNGSNRSEPVTFLEPGTYLVICNVRPHLLDGMLARVRVSN